MSDQAPTTRSVPQASGQAPLVQSLRKLAPAARDFVRTRTFDIVTLGLAAISLLAFTYGAFHTESRSGIGGPTAKLLRGSASRKAAGEKIFVDAAVGESFYDLDAIWTGKDRTAELWLESGTTIELGEKTLVILKRPFRQKFNLAVNDQIRVISGKVRLTGLGTGLIRPAREAISLGKGGKGIAGEETLKEDRASKVFPPDGALLYYRNPGTVEVRVAWTNLVEEMKSGGLQRYLKITRKNGEGAFYVDLGSDTFAPAALKNGFGYEWSIIDENKANLLGPFSFELHILDEETAKRLLNEKPANPLFVYW